MKMNVPNRLTIIRLLLVPVFLVFILGFGGVTWGRIVSIAVFALASFTDFLDGKIARKYHLITDFGKLFLLRLPRSLMKRLLHPATQKYFPCCFSARL